MTWRVLSLLSFFPPVLCIARCSVLSLAPGCRRRAHPSPRPSTGTSGWALDGRNRPGDPSSWLGPACPQMVPP
ncbi:hypothetical protein SEVIR_8G104675v4 [Setaria viridis]